MSGDPGQCWCEPVDTADVGALTPRQREAMTRYALTGSWKMVAEQMGISISTAKGFRSIVARRFDVSGSIDVFRALGWLRVPDELQTWRTQP